MELSSSGNILDERLGAVFAALADPTRRRIVERLRGRDATVTELADELAVRTPSMSKHLSVLESAGLVSRRAEAQRRHCTLEPDAFAALSAWLAHHESAWQGRLDRLDGLFPAEAAVSSRTAQPGTER